MISSRSEKTAGEWVRIAMPLVLLALSYRFMVMVDMWLTANLGVTAQSGLALAALPLSHFGTFVGGLNQAISIRAGVAAGAGAKAALRAIHQSGVTQAVIVSAVLIALVPPMHIALRQSPIEGAVADAAFVYLSIRMTGYFIQAATFSYSNLLFGIGRMKEATVAFCSGMIANLPVSVVLVFGVGPLPALGVAGAALGTLFGEAVSLIILARYVRAELRLCGVEVSTPVVASLEGEITTRWVSLKNLLTLGLPIGVGKLFEEIGWIAGAWWVAAASAPAVAAHGVLFSIHAVTWTIVFALHTVLLVEIAQLRGAGESGQIRRIAGKGLLVGLAYIGLANLLIFGLRGYLGRTFGGNVVVEETIVESVVVLAAFQVVNLVVWILEAVLRGLGDVRPVMIARVITGALVTACAWWAVQVAGLGAWGLWMGLTVGFLPLMVFCMWRATVVLPMRLA